MSFEITGKLFKKFETQSKTETFQAREFVLEHSPTQYPQYIKFQLVQDRCNLIDDYAEGSEMKVYFDIRGNKWTDPNSQEDKFFTNLNAWKVEKSGAPQVAQGPAAASTANPVATGDQMDPMGEDDLPF